MFRLLSKSCKYLAIFFFCAYFKGACCYALEQTPNTSLKDLRNACKQNKSYDEIAKLCSDQYLANSDADRSDYTIFVSEYLSSRDIRKYAILVIEYCDKSLKYPISLENRIKIYNIKGNAMESILHVPDNKMPVTVDDIMTVYITAFKYIIENQTQNAHIPLPGTSVVNYLGPKNSQIYQDAVKASEIQRDERDHIKSQNALVKWHDILIQSIRRVKNNSGINVEKVRILANPIMHNEDHLEVLLNSIQ